MTTLLLTPADRSVKRAQAHPLKPTVLIGDQGLTDAVVAEIDRALAAHGLIKVRVASDDRQLRADMMERICHDLKAAPVQSIGKILVLFRPVPTEAHAPAAAKGGKKAAPKQVKVVVPSSSPTHRARVKRVTVLGNERLTATGKVKRAKPRQSSIKKIRLG
ncbi:MAG: ribosome assembly RNA-binding protein YhbY [Betaproteobacteria bacterium]|nr:ribosome assembly RNA-binding protein YhbY [Betaproteobacteria bacterium]